VLGVVDEPDVALGVHRTSVTVGAAVKQLKFDVPY
jgi:hypothetical protein